jgi:3-hydroxybutyryl-CoA dehydrogenase
VTAVDTNGGTVPQAVDRVTIVGAGVQGSMLAFRCAIYGKRVAVFDVDAGSLERARGKIDGWLAEFVAEEKLDEDCARRASGDLTFVADLDAALAEADIVIENVPEQLAMKQAVWEEIDARAPRGTLLTTNSSSLRSSEIGERVARKDLTFNVNFMTPTEDDLVEVMWNGMTSETTKARALEFLRSIACVPIVTKREIKGFSLNRVWRAMKKECLKLWAEGYIEPGDLDRAFMMEWGTGIGPFGLMDKVGLDVVRDIELSYHRESGDQADLPPTALEDMVAAGHLGEKSGRGFYRYPDPAYARPGWLRSEKGEGE